MVMARIIGIMIFCFGLIAIVATVGDLTPFWLEQKNQKIESLWKQDLELLVRNRKLPKEWIDVSEVKVNPLGESAKNLLKDIQVPISTKPNGAYTLEVSVDDWEENGKKGVMIQYQLFDNKSQNLVWELGRTLETNLL